MNAKLASDVAERSETRRAPRHGCEVETTCQPPSAYAKDPWPAKILDISAGGMRLTLGRRFERGVGLSIQLPADDGTTSTVLGRVAHVAAAPGGGWLIGVALVSELSDEEVGQVLTVSAAPPAAPVEDAPHAPSTISGVLFQARDAGGRPRRWFVKRLDHAGDWPPPHGKVVTLRYRGKAVSLRVLETTLSAERWVVRCDVVA